jgi:hypothetical protein
MSEATETAAALRSAADNAERTYERQVDVPLLRKAASLLDRLDAAEEAIRDALACWYAKPSEPHISRSRKAISILGATRRRRCECEEGEDDK